MDAYKKLITTLNLGTPWSNALWMKAESFVGLDASPKDVAIDDLACAESVSDVIIACGIKFPLILSTSVMYDYLTKSNNWVIVTKPLKGDIIISPTGSAPQGGKNGIDHGHVGILSNNNVIMSNTSATGIFSKNYNIDTWTKRYATTGGYPIYYFRVVTNG